MAIAHTRVDKRLIHGQVTIVWTNTVGAIRAIVVNDEAVKDEMIITGLKITEPAGVKLSILPRKWAVKKFAERTYEDDKVFLITRNVGGMAGLVKAGLPVLVVNVENIAKWEGSRPIKKSMNLIEQDIVGIEGPIKSGVPVTTQIILSESDQTILNYL